MVSIFSGSVRVCPVKGGGKAPFARGGFFGFGVVGCLVQGRVALVFFCTKCRGCRPVLLVRALVLLYGLGKMGVTSSFSVGDPDGWCDSVGI